MRKALSTFFLICLMVGVSAFPANAADDPPRGVDEVIGSVLESVYEFFVGFVRSDSEMSETPEGYDPTVTSNGNDAQSDSSDDEDGPGFGPTINPFG